MTPIKKVNRYECECTRCGHKWIAKSDAPPVRCASPACRSPYWNQEKKATGEISSKT
jgi:hypothetical protein